MISYFAVPASIVVDINDACGSGVEAGLHKVVVFREVRVDQRSAKDVVSEELPANRQTEGVETIVLNEMIHLSFAVVAIVFEQWWPSCGCLAVTIGVAAKVKSGDIDSIVLEMATGGRRASWAG